MPTSHWSYISKIVDTIKKYNPSSILEIGVGAGKYGILSREYLEIYGANRWQKKDWKVIIDGVEIYKPYITDQIKHYYSNIYNDDIVNLFKTNQLGKYDLILMTDVLEHLTKENGIYILAQIFEHSKASILAVPIGDWRYEFEGENKAESHISIWNDLELLTDNFVDGKMYSVSNKEIGIFIYENS